MEKKERYIKYDPDDNGIITRTIYDTIEKKPIIVTVDRCIVLLNQQNNRIKELEEELKNEEQLHDLCIEDNQKDKDFLRKQIKFESDARNRFMKENQQLKQELQEERAELQQLYSHLGVEAFGEDIQEQAVKEINKIKEENQQLKPLKPQLEELEDGTTICKWTDVEKENQQLKQQVEELKGKRLKFYKDDVRQTQVINGVHFDIEQLLVFSEYVENQKSIESYKNKQISELKQQLHDLPKKIVGEIKQKMQEKSPFCITLKDLDTILKKFGGENE